MTPQTAVFADRRDAGRRLALALEFLRGQDPLVLALPRGGVPVGFEVARALGAELDILLVRKIGAPRHEEYGLGAVVDGSNPQVIFNDDVMRDVAPSAAYVEEEIRRQLKEIERRRSAYLGNRPPSSPTDRNVVLVDDGIATGGTIRAALRALRSLRPRRLIVAIPVAPPDVLVGLRREADDVICLQSPPNFRAVGLHYNDFGQIGDEEVVSLLSAAQPGRRTG
ncbi:phosphoribosyltransferase [Hansschlegelia sp.]|uniref:phosphoribosyltransferase n=1 Tax=Hansschlegelia sp. TaxID=2041892 RepID=UPI002CAB23FA|nr:phosphoribosyltransferase [Hansschlegelia sp.]HVI28721.1 phosphoribosyltransferase [Hansschlegelia sp.]